MTTNIVTQDNMITYNAEMAKIMGVADDDDSSETKTSTLARVKIIHAPIMGMKTIDGEETETVVGKGGSYSIQMPDDKIVYGSKLTMRPLMQRYMYKKYVQGTDADNPGYFVKTIMADSLNQDLKDTHGGYNCGKPAGYIKDFKALSEDMQKLIRTIKRVRVIFGLATINSPLDESGKKVNDFETSVPVSFEVDNRTSFKTSGEPFASLSKRKHYPPHHEIDFTTEAQELQTGAKYYTVLAKLNSKSYELNEQDADTLQSFLDWITNYNSYVTTSFDEKRGNSVSQEEAEIIDQIVGNDLPEIEVA